MATDPPPAPAQPPFTLGRAAPGLFVTDIDRSVAFYRDRLGFTVEFTNGDPLSFVILVRDGAELHLQLVPGHRASPYNVAHLLLTGAPAFHDHLVAHGVEIVKPLREADYEMVTFVLADPDGNRIDVGEYL